jgi:hypothetical protein
MMYRDYPERYQIVGRAMPDGPRLAVPRDRSRTSRLRATRAIAIAALATSALCYFLLVAALVLL